MNPAYEALQERFEPALGRSMALALLVHLALFAVLVLGVRWQSRPPEAVTVELWEAPPEPPARLAEPPPRLEPTPAPKPEPRIEKPEIALKEPPKPKPKPEPPKAEPKPEPAKPKPRVDEFRKQLREQLAREQATIAQQRREQELRDLLARNQSKARDEYIARIKAKVKGNFRLSMDLKGNPEVVFNVVQLPTGEIISAKVIKASGIPTYDAEVERAILRSSPLPPPPSRELFERELKLTFRPIE